MRGTRLQQSVEEALVEVCRGQHPVLPEGPGAAEEFADAARQHRVAPLAHVGVRETSPDAAALLKRDRDRALMHHLRTSALLGGLARTLDGVRWVTFKGPVLSEFAHPIPGLRAYSDLDVLVSPTEFRDTLRRLTGAGWRPLWEKADLLSPEQLAEIVLVDPHGVVLDLHWSVVGRKAERRRIRVDPEALLDRRARATIGPVKLWVFSHADALVHVCVHAALIGATRLGNLLDADQLARQVEDWDEVVERTREWGAVAEVAVVLGRARRTLGTPVPSDLERRLGLGWGMAALLAAMDRWWPVQTLRQDASWLRLLTRGLRPGLVGTAATVVGKLLLALRGQVRPPDLENPPATEESIEAYLTMVESSATGRG